MPRFLLKNLKAYIIIDAKLSVKWSKFTNECKLAIQITQKLYNLIIVIFLKDLLCYRKNS